MKYLSYDLTHTAFFPLTGNPVGFHHLLLAECVLRQFPELEQIVIILSNGKHPDPTKEQAIAPKHLRLEILEKAIEEWNLPLKSFVAKIAQNEQQAFKLNQKNVSIALAEFEQDQPVSLYNHLIHLQQNALPRESSPSVQMIVGEDLLRRMNNPQIFTDAEIQGLAKIGRFLIAPRENFQIADAIQSLKQERGVAFDYAQIHLELLPETLHPFLKSSSTLIRKNVQAQHALTGFLPETAAKKIAQSQLYQQQHSLEILSEWEQACERQEQEMTRIAHQLKSALDHRAEQGLPHTLALVETSTGGWLTTALGSLPGISTHFKESAIVYDQAAKNRLLGTTGKSSAVSSEMALQLAVAFQQQTHADFVLAETGMAGPIERIRKSDKQGFCYFALASSDKTAHFFYQSNPFLSKKEHQLLFASMALKWLLENL